MFKLLDRQLFFSYLKSYFVCFVSLMSLFIVVDLFTNLDNFAENHKGLEKLFTFIGTYYAAKSALIFDRLSEAIVLLAAMFTVAWTQRNNEILPLLSAGVSTRRVVQPVLVAAAVMVGVAVCNQELLIPTIDPNLVERKDDTSEKEMEAKGGFESNGILLRGTVAWKKNLSVSGFTVIFPTTIGFEGLPNLQAKEAFYMPADGERRACWKLVGTTPPRILTKIVRDDILENPVDGKYILYVKEMDFDAVTRPKNWMMFESTAELLTEQSRVDPKQRTALMVLFHTRLTRPILSLLLVFMGLAVILRDQNRNIFISAGLCLGLCVVFFLAGFACKYLGDQEKVAPYVAAWLPFFVFGPLAVVMFDAVHT
jgi:lipopolysaccharide export system permease protein